MSPPPSGSVIRLLAVHQHRINPQEHHHQAIHRGLGPFLMDSKGSKSPSSKATSGQHGQQSLGKPHIKKKQKKKKGPPPGSSRGSVAMLKWTIRSQSWLFTFLDSTQATVAAVALCQASNRGKRGHMLDVHVPVRVVGSQVHLKWKHPVVGKTVHAWIHKDPVLMKIMMKSQTWTHIGIHEEVQQGIMAIEDDGTVNNGGMPMAAKSPTTQQGYPDLPMEYHEASLERPDWFGTVTEPAKPRHILEKYGFIMLRKYVPIVVVAPARACVESHFKKIMGSLTNGYATQDFDKLDGLPTKVWSYQSISGDRNQCEKIVTLQRIGGHGTVRMGFEIMGCFLNDAGHVISVTPDSPADKEGVKMGWVVLEIDDWPFKASSYLQQHPPRKRQRQKKEEGGSVTSDSVGRLVDVCPSVTGTSQQNMLHQKSCVNVGASFIMVMHVKFLMKEAFSIFALEHKWGVMDNVGYMRKFGGGRLSKPRCFEDLGHLTEVQMYMRLASVWA